MIGERETPIRGTRVLDRWAIGDTCAPVSGFGAPSWWEEAILGVKEIPVRVTTDSGNRDAR
jgi:hypothetical protein